MPADMPKGMMPRGGAKRVGEYITDLDMTKYLNNNNPANFTAYSAEKNGVALSESVRQNELLLNPMQQIGSAEATVAPHWYIRHGAIDRDTASPIPLNLAVKLQNAGKDVNYLLAWNRPHSGDYALQELFDWLDKLVK